MVCVWRGFSGMREATERREARGWWEASVCAERGRKLVPSSHDVSLSSRPELAAI